MKYTHVMKIMRSSIWKMQIIIVTEKYGMH